MNHAISNADDIIDSRDVIERIDELASLESTEHDSDLDDDERAELEALRALAKQGELYAADWNYGETLIRETYFTEYAQELAEDIGAVPSDAPWPCYCIDWERAARDLRMDYTEVDFDGVAYLIRS